MSLLDIRLALDKRKISSPELVKEYMDKIRTVDTELRSYITVCGEKAAADAQRAQTVIDAGHSRALTGIPLSVKDNICTAGVRTTCASRMLEDFVPFYNACVIDRLLAENYVLLGKTNMDEFAMGGSSQTSYFGGVRNPYDTSRIAGGSSGGAAASVAAGLCAAALGSDTGGSVRQPAAFCGVTGLKPTYGTVSRWGLVAFASSLDQIGVCARSAFDAGYVLSVIGGRDENDPTTAVTGGGYTKKCGSDIKGLKIGVPKEFLDVCDYEIRQAVMNAALYYRALGCEVRECSLPSLEYAVSAYYLISSAEAASNLSRFDGIRFGHCAQDGADYNELISKSRAEGFGWEVKRRIILGSYALCSGYYDAYYNNARRVREQIRREYVKIFESCDVLLTPTVPSTAYKAGEKEHDPVQMYSSDICTVPVNIAGLPAVSTTCGYDKNGMPIGMSIVGKAFDEQTIIAVCDRFERDFDRREAAICDIVR